MMNETCVYVGKRIMIKVQRRVVGHKGAGQREGMYKLLTRYWGGEVGGYKKRKYVEVTCTC